MYALIQKSDNKILRIGSDFYNLSELKPFYWIECPENCTIMWTFDGENFIEPEPTIQ